MLFVTFLNKLLVGERWQTLMLLDRCSRMYRVSWRKYCPHLLNRYGYEECVYSDVPASYFHHIESIENLPCYLLCVFKFRESAASGIGIISEMHKAMKGEKA